MGDLVLEVKNVSNHYLENRKLLSGKGEKKQVLRNVSFSMKAGEVLGLVGESGCGKTTLSRAILGLLKDYEGEIIHHSTRPQMIFQDPYSSLNPSKKLGWILEEPLKNAGGSTKEERRGKALEMLRQVGLEESFADRYPRELSGGQRQRVCIGAALMSKPALLIADEPVSALDVTIQAQVMELLKKLHRERNLAILFISHDLRVVYQMCDRIMIMKDGEIVESGRKDDVYFSPRHEYTRQLLEAAGI